MAKYSVYEDKGKGYPKDKRTIEQTIADWKFVGNADSIEDAYKFVRPAWIESIG